MTNPMALSVSFITSLYLVLALITATPSNANAKVAPESIKKITKTPTLTAEEEAKNELALSPSETTSVEIIQKSKVVTEPAPGTAAPEKPDEAPPEAAKPAAEPAKPTPTASANHGSGAGVSAEQSLKWLVNGNTRYVTKRFRADGRNAEDRKRLVAGQKPHAIVLSCADSRVPPEIVFDQTLGEIFVIRVAGEVLDPSVIASIEYAVEHLGPKLLIVMGHTKCGAVDTALKIKDGESAGSESLDHLLAEIRPHLKTITTQKPSPDLEVESALNADGVARDLVKRSEIVRKKVEAHELLIKSALYRLDSGKVSFY